MLRVKKITESMPLLIIILIIVSNGDAVSIKALSTSCLCDVSDTCDY